MKPQTQSFFYTTFSRRRKAGEMFGDNIITKVVHHEDHQDITFVRLSKYWLIRKIQILCIKK
jgi:hypothetical protein